MIELMEHQSRCVKEYSNRSVLLAHEMGTGKSISAIAMHSDRGAIIVCPAKLKQNWNVELMKMGVSENDIQIIETSKDELRNAKWLIISYSVIDKFVDRLDFYTTMVCDESHFIKGSSKRSKAVVKISKMMDVVTLLSGTAIMNRPIELWNQLTAIGADITKEMNRTQFSKRYCGGHMQQMGRRRFWWEGGAGNLEELKEKLRGTMDSVKKADVLDIPEKVVSTNIIEFTADQRREYKNKFENYLAWLRHNPDHFQEYIERKKVKGKIVETKITPQDQFNNIVKTKQLVELGKLKQVTSLAKVDYFLSILEEIGDQQCIVFTEYLDSIDRLNAGLKKAGMKYSTLKDDGSVEQFQSGKAQFFTANIVSGGQGLNLQNASLVFILDRHWTPGQNEQAEDRVHRKGQTEKCSIFYVTVKDTIDEKLEEINQRKSGVIKKLMD